MRALVEPLPPSGGPPKGDDVANRVIGACARASAAPARRRRRRLEFCERWPALVRAGLYAREEAMAIGIDWDGKNLSLFRPLGSASLRPED
jgi:hypothetical protein